MSKCIIPALVYHFDMDFGSEFDKKPINNVFLLKEPEVLVTFTAV
jgi:hypothetical protein